MNTKSVDNVIVVYLAGRLDIHLSKDIGDGLFNIINDEAEKHLLLNLKEVEYINSAVFGIIISAKNILQKTNRSLKLCNMSDAVGRVFIVLHLIDMFEIYESEEDAIASFEKLLHV